MSSTRFACGVSTRADSAAAEREAMEQLEAGLDGAEPDLVVGFATHHHGEALERLGPRLERRTGAPVVIGCTAESVIGGTREVERSAGIALWAASLPGTQVRFFETSARRAEDGSGEEYVFHGGLPPIGEPERSAVLLVADPFSFPIDAFLGNLNEAFAGVPAVGGMASGATGPGQTLLFTADGVRESGAIGAVIEGDMELRPVVSQGCRPVGSPWVITDAERNLIRKLGGRPALEVLMETWHGLPTEEQALLQSSPFVGIAVDPTRSDFARGDFLVRGIMGLNHHERAIAVADFVRRGQTVQLLVRDAASAGDDLRRLIRCQGGGALVGRGADGQGCGAGAGALLFSCNGRGSRMFQVPDHDVGCIRSELADDLPVAGFFAAGEIGPVGGRNFLHGFTASVAVFRRRDGTA